MMDAAIAFRIRPARLDVARRAIIVFGCQRGQSPARRMFTSASSLRERWIANGPARGMRR